MLSKTTVAFGIVWLAVAPVVGCGDNPAAEQVAAQQSALESPRCGPGPVCDVTCEFGHQLDDNGCVTCACNPRPKLDDPCANVLCAEGTHCEVENVQCFVAPCPPIVTCVPDKRPVCESGCGLYCEFGNVLDENGCPLCRCNPPPWDDTKGAP
jgi:hypothetical protein